MTTTKTSPREAIIERLASDTNYSLDMDFARHFAALTGRPETSVLSNVRLLISANMRAESGRGAYERSLRNAVESIWSWFGMGERGEFNTEDVIAFVESHDQQCVWAVLIGAKMAKGAEVKA